MPRPANLLKKRPWHKLYRVDKIYYINTQNIRAIWLTDQGFIFSYFQKEDVKYWKSIIAPSRKRWIYKGSRPDVFCKKYVLKNCTNFTGKHKTLIQLPSCFLLRTKLSKKRLWHRGFMVSFVKFPRRPFLQNTSSGNKRAHKNWSQTHL